MSDPLFDTAVFGDGVITFPEMPKEKTRMPIQIGDTISELLLTETAGNLQASNRNTRGGFDTVAVAMAGTVQANFAEVGLLEGRTASGVLATPVAGPANKAV